MCAEPLSGFVRFSTKTGQQIGWITGSQYPVFAGLRCASPSEITHTVRTLDDEERKLWQSDVEPATLSDLFPVGMEVHFEDDVEAYKFGSSALYKYDGMIGQTLFVKRAADETVTVATKDGQHERTANFHYVIPGKFVIAPFPLKSWVKVIKFDDDPKLVGEVGEVVAHCHDGTVKVQLESVKHMRETVQMNGSCLVPTTPISDRPKFLAGQLVRMTSEEQGDCLNSEIHNQNIGVVRFWSEGPHIRMISLRDSKTNLYYNSNGLEEIPTHALRVVQVIDDKRKLLDQNDFDVSGLGIERREVAERIANQKGEVVGECLIKKKWVVLFPSLNLAIPLNRDSVVDCE